MKLDIVRSQIVVMNGYNCIVRHVDDRNERAVLEYPNGVRATYTFEEILDQNDWMDTEEDCPDWWEY